MPLFGCSSSETNLKQPYVEEWRASNIEGFDLWGDEGNAYFSEILSAYKSEGCQIKFTQRYDQNKVVNRIWGADIDMGFTPGGPYGDIFVKRFYEKYSQSKEFSDELGNIVDKTLIMTSSYYSKLRMLFEEINLYYSENPKVVTPWEIYFNPEKPSEQTSGSTVKEFENYLRDTQETAKRLCYTSKKPTDAQILIAEKKFEQFLNNWQQFNAWLIDSEIYINMANERLARQADIDALYDAPEQRVQCEEFKTNIPDKVLVRCDLP